MYVLWNKTFLDMDTPISLLICFITGKCVPAGRSRSKKFENLSIYKEGKQLHIINGDHT